MLDGKDAQWKDARKAAADLLKKPGAVILVSAWNSNETFAAVKEFVSANFPSARLHGYANPGRADEAFPGFTISGDKNPNRAGMKEILGIDPDASLRELAAGKEAIGTLLLIHNIANYTLAPELKAVLDRTESVVLMDFAKSDLLKYGNVAAALPTLTTFEKSGTFVNRTGVHQKFLPVMEPVSFGRGEAEMLQELARESKTQAAGQSSAASKVKV
jgi:hypothetical protein